MKHFIFVVFYILVLLAIGLDSCVEDKPANAPVTTSPIYEFPFNWAWEYRLISNSHSDSVCVGDTILVMYEKFIINQHDSSRVKYVKADTGYFKFVLTLETPGRMETRMETSFLIPVEKEEK